MQQMLIVGLGGFIGSIARYMAGQFVGFWQPLGYPMTTLLVNSFGSFLIGLMWGFSDSSALKDSNLWLFIVVGILGGFTTFSAFSLENFQLAQNDNWPMVAFNIFFQSFAGLALCYAGKLIPAAILN